MMLFKIPGVLEIIMVIRTTTTPPGKDLDRSSKECTTTFATPAPIIIVFAGSVTANWTKT